MIRLFEGSSIHRAPALRDAMFRDRKAQFVDRLGWPLKTDGLGREIDQYDRIDPIYIVSLDRNGRHEGSLRLLPTLGRTMIAEHFVQLMPDGFARAGVYECTRFCVSPGAGAHVSARLFLAVLDLGLSRGWRGSYGVFDARMMRIYQRLGTPARMISQLGHGPSALCLGYFDFDPSLRAGLAGRALEPALHAAA